VRLTRTKQAEIRKDVREDAEERAAVVDNEIERHQRKIKKIKANQARLVQLFYKDLVSEDVLASEQKRLQAEDRHVRNLLAQAELQAEDIAVRLEDVRKRTSTPYQAYRRGSPLERRLLNQTFFKRILIGEASEVLGVTLTPAYAAVAEWDESFGQPQTPEPSQEAQAGLEAPSPRSPQEKTPTPFLGARVRS